MPRVDAVTLLAVATVAVPMLVLVLRLAGTGHVYLGFDLALTDLRVRNALHFGELLGPYDRFGWKHPGPVYFYLLAAVHSVVGDGGRTEFIGAALVNAAAMLSTILVVRRRAGQWAALWCAGCLAALALAMSGVTPLGVLLSPWNPDVVVFPLVLLGVLCAAAATGSWASLAAAAVVGSFTVQTDIATLPLVAVFVIGAAAAAAFGPWRTPPRPAGRAIGVGACAVVLLWLPPIVQQLTTTPGNITLIWRFFNEHSTHPSLPTGLKIVLTADQYLLGIPHQLFLLPPLSGAHAAVILAVLVALSTAAVALGHRRAVPLAVVLGIAGVVGLAIGAYAMTRVVGLVYPYLVQWEVAVPVLAVIGVGVAAFGARAGPVTRSVLCAAVLCAGVAFSARTAGLPASEVSDTPVAAAWHLVAPRLGPHPGEVYLESDAPAGGTDVLFGLVDELEARGARPRVAQYWSRVVGDGYVTGRPAARTVMIYPPSTRVERSPGYAGRAGGVDIVVVRHPSPTVVVVTAPSLPAATPRQPYSTMLAALGGLPPYRWSLVSGSLPDGLSLKHATGVISGTPDAGDAGTSTFTVGVSGYPSPGAPAAADEAQEVMSIPVP